MPGVRFEPTITVFELAKTVHALDRAATVIGSHGAHYHILQPDGSGSLQTLPVGRSVKLLLVFASTVISRFGLLEIHDHEFYSVLDMYIISKWGLIFDLSM
jgi:hypothetical protein